MNNSEINIDLKVVCNAYVLTEVMLGPYHTEILENLQQAQDLEYKSKKISERVERRGELIAEVRNISRARIARINTKKLRRLQTIDKRRAKALLTMSNQVKDKMFKKIEFVVRKKYT
jgi:DNA anti-recombination protein RmuC